MTVQNIVREYTSLLDTRRCHLTEIQNHPIHTQPEPTNRNSPMKTIILTPELVSLNLFYLGVTFLLLGSIARRWVEIKKVAQGKMKLPPLDGRHGREEKIAMYPLKVTGYLLAISAIAAHMYYAPGEYRLPMYYVLFTGVYLAIPRCFKPQEGYTSRDCWSVQRERLKAAHAMYAISILLIPTSIFAKPFIATQLLLLIIFLYEYFFFSNKEETVWRDSAHFDLACSEKTDLPVEE